MSEISAIVDVVRRRASCRAYRGDPVPDSMLEVCLEAARLAPSACNKQPWRFLVVRDPDSRAFICDRCLQPGIPMPWLRQAPVIIVLCAETSLAVHRLAPMVTGVHYHLLDAGIAGEHFVLSAEAQGLGTCWIGWFKPGAIRKRFGIPRAVEVVSLLSVGFPAVASPPDNPVTKLPLCEVARTESWNHPFAIQQGDIRYDTT
jgi:nitroreductase